MLHSFTTSRAQLAGARHRWKASLETLRPSRNISINTSEKKWWNDIGVIGKEEKGRRGNELAPGDRNRNRNADKETDWACNAWMVRWSHPGRRWYVGARACALDMRLELGLVEWERGVLVLHGHFGAQLGQLGLFVVFLCRLCGCFARH